MKEKMEKKKMNKLVKGGLVLGKRNKKEKEEIYFIDKDTHTLILGATRSGKGRTVVMQTLCTLGLAGESMIITDPKSELFDYTSQFLKWLGYQIITIDFKNPKKSHRWNFLQIVNNSIDQGDIPGAVDAAWDITSQLVGEPKGEKLWNNGEAATIAASIMAVCYDNRAPENHKYRNLLNVYFFLIEMCTEIEIGNKKKLPLTRYVEDIPENHPARGILAISSIAPSRTRSSFYTSALITLRLFTNPLIADMTSQSDYDCMAIGKDKTAIFIMLPDEKKTYYSIASLYVAQQYAMLSKSADLRGGRLEKRVNYIMDEFGNFAQIPIMTNMLTVGGGKGIRFNLFVQDFAQIEEKYEKVGARTIMSNCETWLYLQSDDNDTLEAISKKLGKYTTQTYSLSSSNQKYGSSTSGNNVSLTGRDLLTPAEVKKIHRPYNLVTSRNDPAVFYSPDLSQWNFNKVLGLGNEEHNRKIRLARENMRPERKVSEKLELWGIWNIYKEAIVNQQKKEQMKEQRELFADMMSNMNF